MRGRLRAHISRPNWSGASVRCEIVRWLADEPQPGWVEARLLDAAGHVWEFHDKPPIFTTQPVTPTTEFPISGEIRCTVLSRLETVKRKVVKIATHMPDGLESTDGITEFMVDSDLLVQRSGRRDQSEMGSPSNTAAGFVLWELGSTTDLNSGI